MFPLNMKVNILFNYSMEYKYTTYYSFIQLFLYYVLNVLIKKPLLSGLQNICFINLSEP
jgi:hypothetical protein